MSPLPLVLGGGPDLAALRSGLPFCVHRHVKGHVACCAWPRRPIRSAARASGHLQCVAPPVGIAALVCGAEEGSAPVVWQRRPEVRAPRWLCLL